jgi:hypothetical protein
MSSSRQLLRVTAILGPKAVDAVPTCGSARALCSSRSSLTMTELPCPSAADARQHNSTSKAIIELSGRPLPVGGTMHRSW